MQERSDSANGQAPTVQVVIRWLLNILGGGTLFAFVFQIGALNERVQAMEVAVRELQGHRKETIETNLQVNQLVNEDFPQSIMNLEKRVIKLESEISKGD